MSGHNFEPNWLTRCLPHYATMNPEILYDSTCNERTGAEADLVLPSWVTFRCKAVAPMQMFCFVDLQRVKKHQCIGFVGGVVATSSMIPLSCYHVIAALKSMP